MKLNLFNSVRNKIISGFLAVALLVSIASLTGILMIDRVVAEADQIILEEMVLKDRSYEALVGIEKILSNGRKYLQEDNGLGALRQQILKQSGAFFGILTDLKKMSGSHLQDSVDTVSHEYEILNSALEILLNKHDERVKYHFNHKGTTYNIKAFAYFLDVSFTEWATALEESTKFNTGFEHVDASTSDFQIWNSNFVTADTELQSIIKKLEKQNKRIYKQALKINKASEKSKKSQFSRFRARNYFKAKAIFRNLRDYAGSKYDQLSQQENQALDKMDDSAAVISNELARLRASIDEEISVAKEKMLQTEQFAFALLSIVGVLAVIAAIGFGVFTAMMITRPLKKAVDFANRLAKGDMTLSEEAIKGGDEPAQLLIAMSDMAARLNDLIRQINTASSEVESASSNQLKISEQSRNAIQKQSFETANVSSSVTEMSAAAQEIASNAESTYSSAKNADAEANTCKELVVETSRVLENLSNEVDVSVEVVNRLHTHGEKITEVLDIISSIAEQINLLALNAAIEAARAGDQGRGFAVVADEVRSLAHRTQVSTEDIQESIKGLRTITDEVVTVMKNSQSNTELAVDQANKAASVIQNITLAVADITECSNGIAIAAKQQTVTTDEISRNVFSISQSADEALEVGNQVGDSSRGLTQLASNLNSLVNHFKV